MTPLTLLLRDLGQGPAARHSGCDAVPALPCTLAAWLDLHDFPGVHARGANGETPLMRAALRGERGMVDMLIAQGAHVLALDDDGNNALWFACQNGAPAIVLRLIEAGVPVDHANDDDITCLMQAAASGRLELMRLLLAMGARSDVVASDGRSALDMAAERGLALPDTTQQARRARHARPRAAQDKRAWAALESHV